MSEAIEAQVRDAAEELCRIAALQAGQILVVGCSTSEVIGRVIGTSGSAEAAQAILAGLQSAVREKNIFLAIQCCEHLNRALVVERALLQIYPHLEEVTVYPVAQAGGALAAAAMAAFVEPVVIAQVQAHAGLDIGETMIGMHLRPVAVPVRLQRRQIGQARLNAARTRPKLIGGERACYSRP
ncbi:TIGR01440 family protein [Heliophilum fasciatum]|uniref:UPF0340 protein EDD73_106107 n=1 Tax=Heliophilum fasciatum TaxID=35700 RepID=A0A4R2RPR3_9FIRM|nr:TIGR01440 family protein [Heliophilum fasciatum]MCW2277486.1 uncharacterized protein (TIGR01440 family) [Heliophilum fasciatum]TCP65223.1 uncharacterized protein (TIGR01440 family) [Heliophilum fasciatum]